MKCKFFLLLITLLTITSYINAKISSNLKANELNLRKIKKSHFHRSHNGTVANTNNNTTNNTGPLVLNSVGRRVFVNNSTDIVLTNFPFMVSRCDQIVSFQAEYLNNWDEYRSRSNGSFVLTAHYANLFQSSPSQLLKSILLSSTTMAPRVLEGTGNCVVIFSKSGRDDNISMCFTDPNKISNIY